MHRASLLVLLIACGRESRQAPSAPQLRPTSPAVARGDRLFGVFCYQCHPDGAAGLGPALNDKPLPAVAIRTQIRKGVGAMPAFSDAWLNDQQVHDIAEYVQALRASP